MKIRIKKTNRKVPVSPYSLRLYPNFSAQYCQDVMTAIAPIVHTGTTRQDSAWVEFLQSEPIEDWTAFENKVNNKSWWFRLWRKR